MIVLFLINRINSKTPVASFPLSDSENLLNLSEFLVSQFWITAFFLFFFSIAEMSILLDLYAIANEMHMFLPELLR